MRGDNVRVVVIFGGASVEHEISILTGMQAVLALNKDKYEVIPVYLTKDNKFLINKKFMMLDTFKEKEIKGKEVYLTQKGLKRIFTKKVDIALLCVHGKGLEGGELAGYCEMIGLPYTSIGVLGASLCQDKIIFKKLMEYEKINVLPFFGFDNFEWKKNRTKIINQIRNFTFPIILKPANLGSSIGIIKVDNFNNLEDSIIQVFKYDNRVLVEKGLTKFREFNCAIINTTILSDIEEVITPHAILTYEDKYEEGPARRVIPAQVDDQVGSNIYTYTQKIAQLIDNKGVIRIDYLYDLETSTLYVNEVNTIPGSLSFYLFENKGIFFDELLDIIINEAISKFHFNKGKIRTFSSNILNMKGIKK